MDPGDIWRACQTKDVPIRDWVKLAVTRARATGAPAIFWLDESPGPRRQPDREGQRVPRRSTTPTGLDIQILPPVEAIKVSVDRIRKGEDTISVTGNVLRDYLTDLFPILELGTSAKMLSVVPLINGGGLFETGAGGSAPKHVQQLLKENYLRWDSLGEFLALAVSFEQVRRADRQPAGQGARPTPSTAPPGPSCTRTSRRAASSARIDNRGSHFYLALYWAAGARRADRRRRAGRRRSPRSPKTLGEPRRRSPRSCSTSRARPADIGGYYRPDDEKASAVMRPSTTLQRGARVALIGVRITTPVVEDRQSARKTSTTRRQFHSPRSRNRQAGTNSFP